MEPCPLGSGTDFVMLLVIPLFLNRIRIEERLLIEEFGAEYEAYIEATEKLVPRIY